MKTTFLALGLLLAAPSFAQVHVSVGVPAPPVPRVTVVAPTVTFVRPPPLVTVQPGVQVVEDHDDEIFFVDNYYWLRRDGRWWRTGDHHGGWAVVEERVVPAAVVRLPPGHYRHWRKERKEERKEERREERHEEHEEKHKHGKGH